MKTLYLIAALIIINLSMSAQTEKPNSIFTFKAGESEYNIGGYLGLDTKYSRLNDDPVGYVGLKAGVTINSKWTIGLSASGLYYDKKLNKLVNDGTYHLNAGYVGLFIERIIPLDEGLSLNLSIMTGTGEANYQYDRKYRKEHAWYQEFIDKTTFSVFEPGIEIQKQISERFYLGITGSYRFTSPLYLIGMDENALNTFSGGISLKYGIF